MRILSVDDDRGTRNIVSKILTEQAYDVDVACDGPSALELVRHNTYDLAILDYEMPLMNGVELFSHIHKLQPGTIGVFLTGYTSLNTVFPAIDVGISRVLAKPVNARELVATVEEFGHQPCS